MDAQPWPCADTRLRLLDEYRADPIAVSVYLGAALHKPIADPPNLNPDTAPQPKPSPDRPLNWPPPHHLL